MSGQCLQRAADPLWPSEKPPLRQPLLAQPIALPVVDQNLYRRGAPVTEYEQVPTERILGKRLAAHPGQPVDALAEIHRLYRQQDSHLRCDLHHCGRLHSPRSVWRSCPTPAPFNLIVMRVPRGPSFTFTLHSLRPATAAAGSSMKCSPSASDPAPKAPLSFSLRLFLPLGWMRSRR